jgi:hypothetical protein
MLLQGKLKCTWADRLAGKINFLQDKYQRSRATYAGEAAPEVTHLPSVYPHDGGGGQSLGGNGLFFWFGLRS